MKKIELTTGLLMTLLLANPPAMAADEEYPAAYFEPKVIFQDAEYIANDLNAEEIVSEPAAPVAASPAPSVPVYPEGSSPAAESAAAPAASAPAASGGLEQMLKENYWLGLVVLGLAGFVVYSNRSGGAKTGTSASVNLSGLTGVERYVRKKVMSEPTGVARYLEKQEKANGGGQTGVERYLRQHG